MPHRKLTTKQADIRARNRANAQKSTGPKTTAGKARASRNAVRHGLASGKHLDPREEADAAAHDAALASALRPRGPLEAEMVAQLARALARLDRIDRLEGEITTADPEALRRLSGLDRYRAPALAELKRAWRGLREARAFSESEARGAIFPSRAKG